MSPRLAEQFRLNRNKMLRFVERRIDDAEEAEDLLQDLYEKAAESLSLLTPIENLSGWLWRSLKNRIVDYYRTRASERRMSATHDDVSDLSWEDLVPDPQGSAEKQYLRNELIDALYESLDELPDEQREVFLLQAVEGRTFQEIAELTGTSINTLTARKRYAVKFLRRRLAELYELIEEL